MHDAQVAALAEFTALEVKASKLRLGLTGLEASQRMALGRLAELAGVEIAAQLTDLTVAKVREALAERRRHGDARPVTGNRKARP